jgi:PAS domain S-box-containing protein
MFRTAETPPIKGGQTVLIYPVSRIASARGILRMNPEPSRQTSRIASHRPATESLVDLLEEAIIVAGRDASILEWNSGATRVFGWTPDEAQGMSVQSLQSALVVRGLATAVQQVFASGQQWHGESAFLRKGGETGSCEVLAMPISENRVLLSIRDVTARRKNFERVSEERHLLRTVMDGIPDIIILKDADARYVMLNRAHRELTGYPDDRVIGHRTTDLGFPEEYARGYLEDDLSVLRTGVAIINREEPFRCQDGRSGWFLTSKYPLYDTGGRLLGLIAVARNITEMKRAADELAEARMQLSQHLENSLLLVAELDAGRRITRWAGRAEKMFGWTTAEAIGRTLAELNANHPDETEHITGMIHRLENGTEDHSTLRCRNLTKDGRIIHCLWWNSVLRNADGSVRSFLTLAEEITYTVETLEKLQASDRLLNTLIHATAIGYVQLDPSGRILTANDRYLAFFGATQPSDLIGRNYLEFVTPKHRALAIQSLSRLVDEGRIQNLEVDLLGADGCTSTFEFHANAESTGEGMRLHAFCRDISERRRALEERRSMEAKMQETQKLESLGVLAGGIAHDFNNLLTGVLGNVSLAAAEIPAGSAARGFLDQIEKAASRAADLCRQMLAYSGKGRFDVKALDLNALIRETMNLLGISISKRARLDFQPAPALPAVLADTVQLRQIVMNLVINASEALGERDGTVRVSTGTVRMNAEELAKASASPDAKEGEYVWLEVSDTGCGMDADVLKRIFDPFFTTKFTGRGLGLAAVLGIVRGHRGALTVTSTLGKGTCFRVLLPASADAAEMGAAATIPDEEWKGSGLALVVDDEETVRSVATRLLDFLGFQTVTASNGREALEIFPTIPGVRFVFLDLTMPHMDGQETLREMRKLRPDVRVLIMSGFSAQEVANRFAKDGHVDFIQKPFNLALAREKIRRLLD